ncbi:MAG: C4-dicarboxylate transporter [Hyphomicrobiales bacterium]|nr:C4-dicarboxylate transporter [Hyphomicrobiales bacterium]
MTSSKPPDEKLLTARRGFIPVALFASAIGLSALSTGWHLAEDVLRAPVWPSIGIGAAAIVAFICLCSAYIAKVIIVPEKTLAEFRDPIAGNLFGTIFISMLLIPKVLARFHTVLALCIWAVGTVGIFIFNWMMVRRWLGSRQVAAELTPAWFVPPLGLLNVPLATPYLGISSSWINASALAIGSFLCLLLFAIVLGRLIFVTAMTNALSPMLLILAGPTSLAVSSYFVVTNSAAPDLFAESLFAISIFLLAVLAPRVAHLGLACPFRVAWWAVSLPLAAVANAALRIASADRGTPSLLLASVLLGMATVVTAILLTRTVLGILRGELRDLSS